MTLFTLFIAFKTDFPQNILLLSRSSIASCSPVDAPLGTAALPKILSFNVKSTSNVGFPRESSICLAIILLILFIFFNNSLV